MTFKTKVGGVLNSVKNDEITTVLINVDVELNINERSLNFSISYKKEKDEELQYDDLPKKTQENVDWFIQNNLSLLYGFFANMNFHEANITYDASSVEKRLELYQEKMNLAIDNPGMEKNKFNELKKNNVIVKMYFNVSEEVIKIIDSVFSHNIKHIGNIILLDSRVVGKEIIEQINGCIREKALNNQIAEITKEKNTDKKRKI